MNDMNRKKNAPKRRRSSLQQRGAIATTAIMAEGYSTLAFLAIVSSSRRPKDTNIPNLTRRRRDARFDTTTGAKSGSSVVHYFSDFIDNIPVLRLGRVASLRARGEVERKAFAGSLEGLAPPASERAMYNLARAIDELNSAMSGSKEKKEETSLENLLRLVRKARERVSALNCFVWPVSMRRGILWYVALFFGDEKKMWSLSLSLPLFLLPYLLHARKKSINHPTGTVLDASNFDSRALNRFWKYC